jgi:hypothetical protein
LTRVPIAPLAGVNEVIVGAGQLTVNGDELVHALLYVSTLIGPVLAYVGTVA